METVGLSYTPVVTGVAYNQAALTSLPGSPAVSGNHGTTAGGDDDATLVVSQASDTTFSGVSSVPDAGDFTFSTIGWGYFDVTDTFVGTAADLGNSVTLALNGAVGGETLTVEFVSSADPDVKRIFSVTLAAGQQNYTFNITGLGTVAMINIVADTVADIGYTVETVGLAYVSTQAGETYDSTVLTDLTAFSPYISTGSANTGVLSLNQSLVSSGNFEYDYDLSGDSAAYTYTSLNNGGSSVDLSSDGNFVFAARGTDGGRIKVEVKDSGGRTATFVILLSSIYQNYTLEFDGSSVGSTIPALFDPTQITEIVFVQDRNIGAPRLTDFVKIQTLGLDQNVEVFDITRNNLIQNGLDYFDMVDTVTHFPYDHMEDGATGIGYYTQPTLIGFYLQILGDVALGKIDNGMDQATALAEIDWVMDSLLSAQSSLGWNGLLPWINLHPPAGAPTRSSNAIGLGDNANLSQSIAVMIGALESAGLSGNAVITKAENFLDAQAAGYAAFVDPRTQAAGGTGLFRGACDISDPLNPVFSDFIDRIGNEFRGAVAFLAIRYEDDLPIPAGFAAFSVFTNLTIETNSNYLDQNGNSIDNLAPWDGGAFQIFWPGLRNDETSYSGFRDALYNQLVTQLDYAYQNRIPGILSACSFPDSSGDYAGATGIPQMAEANMDPGAINTILGDIGSTYALAAAMGVDSSTVIDWFNAIQGLLAGIMMGDYGFYDSARSGSEISNRFNGIDVASMVLGLAGNGPADFDTYLRNRELSLGLESNYHTLYEQKSDELLASITRTSTVLSSPPEFPDYSLAVFGNFSSEGPILIGNGFPDGTTEDYGISFQYGALSGSHEGGHFWMLDSAYNAQANQLLIYYSAEDSPQAIRIELKAGGTIVYQTTQAVGDDGVRFGRIWIDLPNDVALSAITEIDIMVDQTDTPDASGDFTIHAIDFQHVLSAPAASFTTDSAPVTTLPGNGVASSSGSGALVHVPGTSVYHLDFDLTNDTASAGIVLSFGGSGIDLNSTPSLIFGLKSATVNKVKIKIEDTHGNTYSTSNTDIVADGYYEFLASLAAGKVDTSHIKSITFDVDGASVDIGDEIGDLELEIDGLS